MKGGTETPRHRYLYWSSEATPDPLQRDRPLHQQAAALQERLRPPRLADDPPAGTGYLTGRGALEFCDVGEQLLYLASRTVRADTGRVITLEMVCPYPWFSDNLLDDAQGEAILARVAGSDGALPERVAALRAAGQPALMSQHWAEDLDYCARVLHDGTAPAGGRTIVATPLWMRSQVRGAS